MIYFAFENIANLISHFPFVVIIIFHALNIEETIFKSL